MNLARRVTLAAAAAGMILSLGCQRESQQAAAPTALEMPGQAIYYQQCAICHGRFGKGDTVIAANYPWANLADTNYGYGASRDEILKNVTEGILQTPMRGFKGALSDQEIGQVVDYVIALGKQGS